MDLVAGGDRQAFAVLIERHRHRAMRLAYTVTRNRSAAEDVVQEAFLRVWTRRATGTDAAPRGSPDGSAASRSIWPSMERAAREDHSDDKLALADPGLASDDAVHAGQIARASARPWPRCRSVSASPSRSARSTG